MWSQVSQARETTGGCWSEIFCRPDALTDEVRPLIFQAKMLSSSSQM